MKVAPVKLLPSKSTATRAAILSRVLFPLALCGLLLSPPTVAPRAVSHVAQDDEVITVETNLVVLNVTATTVTGDFVRGLTKADFKIFEDGREQTLTNFSEEETPFAATLLLDTSGSMEGRVTLARSAAIRFLDGLRAEDSAAVYSFNSKFELVQDFSNSRDLSPKAFDLGAKGWTILNDAVLKASGELSKRPEKRRAIVVLSDGADTRSSASAEKALDAALAANVTIYSVDIGQAFTGSPNTSTGAGTLRNFAGKSGGRYVGSPGGQALREAFAEIVDELSNQYTVGYRPTNRARDGRWRSIEVKINRPNVSARTRRGYKLGKS